jgi:hypothetical protein
MSKEPTSLQNQSPLSQAQDSVTKATNAVNQAQSHPSGTTIQQAENAMDKALKAVAQAQQTDNQKALQETELQLNEIQNTLSDLSS